MKLVTRNNKLELFLNKILLKDEIEFRGSIEELKKRLNEPKGRKYDIEWISNYEFKFLSKWSIGTMMLKGLPDAIDGIKGYGKIKLDDKIKIYLTTKIRIEIYIIIAFFILTFVVSIFSNGKIPMWIHLLFPIFLIWFWGVYRIQENKLFNTVKKHLLNQD